MSGKVQLKPKAVGPPSDTEKKKVFIFGSDRDVMRQMSSQLGRQNLRVVADDNEDRVLSRLQAVDPELILILINAPIRTPIVDVVRKVFVWIREKAREMNRILKSPSGLLWDKAVVILYKTEIPLGAMDFVGAEIADTDEILSRCKAHGNVHYIGTYAPISFVAKVRQFFEI